MLNLNNRQSMTFVFTLIVLSVGIVAMLYLTILTGHRREWFRMGFCLSQFIYIVFVYIGVIVDMKIYDCFKRLEGIISVESDSIQFKDGALPVPIAIFFGVFIVVMYISSMITAVEKEWLILCVYLTGFAVGNLIFMGAKISLSIKTYAKHIEELICKNSII